MFWNNFVLLCNKNEVSPNYVAKKLGISSGTVTGWKQGSSPRDTALQKIAHYFGVTVEDLLGNTESRPKSSIEATTQKGKGEVIFLPDSNAYMIPLFESVSAGFGAYPNENIISYEICNIGSPAEAAETICIKVKGDSMYPKIEDGDIIQVHKQTSVDSGKIAVVLIDGEEALVKKIVYGSDWIELHSFNPMYPVMRFDGQDVLRVQVLGLVRKIIKNV